MPDAASTTPVSHMRTPKAPWPEKPEALISRREAEDACALRLSHRYLCTGHWASRAAYIAAGQVTKFKISRL
ncbi:DEAD/DEAH box helicase [Aspergillus luchuensis]|uniref:DEAD/DEAH box helicase n=1 Tax=Aspergillus kawachii TaxID=1069201 RepID=A0A146F4Y5_ASPKA|nr:DEAD/DEAH box helicase [Aspergillus luchuensis]